MMTDPIADMLTRIRNAQRSHKTTVEFSFSKLKKAVADILLKEGYLNKVEVVEEKPAKKIALTLKYNGKEPAIKSLVRESTPGFRQYRGKNNLPRVLNDYGVAILSTSQGLMTNKEARKLGVGGELICSVY
jgi:small subunit ribosomal protein S8